jgi:diaminohydroxyphosphoribosylaminopyrimidine deaminase/5-amino-6-(5-phosphoribosylamino)uracil reductase
MVGTDDDRDAMFMDRALLLAERGRGRTSPNPIVGAVVVSADGIVVGQGAHLEAGGPHAEVHALAAAGSKARGATLYCTLEPCCHTGRTGPCVKRIVAAGIARVVAATRDPNPLVAGAGFTYLRSHDVRVDVGLGADHASRQNAPFFTWVTRYRPFVILKAATSSDGFVGCADRRVKLTGPIADRWFQRQRAEIDALVVGSQTVLVDDPLLTPREVYRYRPLTRVLFDRRGRIPATARVFSTLTAGPVIMIVSAAEARRRQKDLEGLERRGVIVDRSAQDLPAVMERLAGQGIVSLLVEGGPTLQAAFVAARLVDRVQLVMTPRVLGEGLTAPWTASVSQPAERRTVRLGEDTLTEFDVHWTD